MKVITSASPGRIWKQLLPLGPHCPLAVLPRRRALNGLAESLSALGGGDAKLAALKDKFGGWTVASPLWLYGKIPAAMNDLQHPV